MKRGYYDLGLLHGSAQAERDPNISLEDARKAQKSRDIVDYGTAYKAGFTRGFNVQRKKQGAQKEGTNL